MKRVARRVPRQVEICGTRREKAKRILRNTRVGEEEGTGRVLRGTKAGGGQAQKGRAGRVRQPSRARMACCGPGAVSGQW